MTSNGPVTWPKVTVAILSWNRLHYLRATLESAHRCIQYPNLEWIVSDNESDEPGLQEYIKGLDWVNKKIVKRQPHAEAMNEIVEKAQGKFLILWPDDEQFITEGEWLKDLIELLNNNSSIGSVTLGAQRRVTLQRVLHPDIRILFPRILHDLYLYRQNIRRAGRLISSRGFTLRAAGPIMPGICGSGIPSLTRLSVWRKLGPWKRKTRGAGSLIDSSMGAEEYMYLRFLDSRLPLQTAFPMIPLAADILTDPLGCKAKIRGRYRYGVYMPPRDPDSFYYLIRNINEFNEQSRDLPFNFSEMVQPIGFQIPKDANGDRLKFPLNTSVVFDMKEQRDVPYPLTILPS